MFSSLLQAVIATKDREISTVVSSMEALRESTSAAESALDAAKSDLQAAKDQLSTMDAELKKVSGGEWTPGGRK